MKFLLVHEDEAWGLHPIYEPPLVKAIPKWIVGTYTWSWHTNWKTPPEEWFKDGIEHTHDPKKRLWTKKKLFSVWFVELNTLEELLDFLDQNQAELTTYELEGKEVRAIQIG
jgi:hypothetical protein